MALTTKKKIIIAIVGGAIVGALAACGAVWMNLAPAVATIAAGIVALIVMITGYKILG